MDVMKTKREEAQEVKSSTTTTTNGSFDEMKKSCIDCHTARTPLWRSGPAGPRSLCNACGIRYRKTKQKKGLLELDDRGRAEERKGKRFSSKGDNSELGMFSVNAGFMAVAGREVGEEELAAFLLMSLSYA